MSNFISPFTPVKDGRFTTEDLKVLWKSIDNNERDIVIKLLQKFEILYPLKNEENVWITPSLLPKEIPRLVEHYWNIKKPAQMQELKRIFKFNFVPLGFISRLIFRLEHLSDIDVLDRWHDGVIMRMNKQLSLVQFNPI